ncbi:hypothetical protein ACE1BJ_14375, partial [Aeromonas jandaei]
DLGNNAAKDPVHEQLLPYRISRWLSPSRRIYNTQAGSHEFSGKTGGIAIFIYNFLVGDL